MTNLADRLRAIYWTHPIIMEAADALDALRESVVEMEAYNDVPSAQDDPVWVTIRRRGAEALAKANR